MKKVKNKRVRYVVINSRYGGYGLSPEAKQRYYARKGITVYFYKYDYSTKLKEYVPLPIQDDRYIHCENSLTGEYLADDIPRDDPDLVEVVEELGKAANSPFADLKVVEIPADVKWQVEDQDGMEHIAEKHRTWS